MKPAPFAYYDPTTLDEVLALLKQYGDEAKLLAGGQSLVPVLNMRLAKPQVLIDLNRVAGLAGIKDEGTYIAIGAMTRHAEVERSELIARRQPLLTEAIKHVGHVQIRTRGTIGGSLVHADPSAELPAVMVALEATMCIAGPEGTRQVPAEDFFLMYFTTCLQPNEILTEIQVPAIPQGARCGWAFEELARRHGDFALTGVACTLTLHPSDGTITDCRLGLTGVGMTPIRPREAEALLIGRTPEPDLLQAAADAVGDGLMPDSDIHATAEYRQELARALTHRALRRALNRATRRGAEGGTG